MSNGGPDQPMANNERNAPVAQRAVQNESWGPNADNSDQQRPCPVPLPQLSPTPLISVIMANYNYGRFLKGAIESVLAQWYQNFELIVCEDGSTDSSAEVLRQVASRDSRIIAIEHANAGQAAALNAAYERARGEIICLLDPDDLFMRNKLSRIVEVFRENNAAGMIHHLRVAATMDLKALPFGQASLESGWLVERAYRFGGRGAGAATSQICLRREVSDILFPLPTIFRLGNGDAFILGAAQFLTEIVGLEEKLSYQLFHGDNYSVAMTPEKDAVCSQLGAATKYGNLNPLNREVRGSIEIFEEIRRFVGDRFGDEYAARLRLRDVPGLWDLLAILFVLEGKPSGGIMGYGKKEIIAQDNSRRRNVWRLLFLMPGFLARRMIHDWWADAAWKRYVFPVIKFLGLRRPPECRSGAVITDATPDDRLVTPPLRTPSSPRSVISPIHPRSAR